MKTNALLSALFLTSALFAGGGSALAATESPAQFAAGPGSEATFLAVGKPSLLKIKGHGAKITGTLTLAAGDLKGSFDLNLNEFDTGIDLRNKHMKEKYLDTGKFPTATVAVTHVELPKGFAPGASVSKVPFQGTLTLKGVTKPIAGTVSISGAQLATTAEFSFSLNDYPVGVPSYLGVSVADRIEVQASLPELARK